MEASKWNEQDSSTGLDRHRRGSLRLIPRMSRGLTSDTRAGSRRPAPRFAEIGLVWVVLLLGLLLFFFGGYAERPLFRSLPDGSRERVTVRGPNGDPTPATIRVNKFANAESLTQLAKDTSFIAIMAVGMTTVIIAGQIDLSIGSIYALAGVLTALVLHHFGPDGPEASQAWAGSILGWGTALGVGLLCGLLNGTMVVALRVHPFIITLGTMAVLRGIAFVVSEGQSIGGFPIPFRNLVTAGTESGLQFRPLLLTLGVVGAGTVFLRQLAVGRRVYAVGGNELASRYSGIRVERIKLGVFMLAGFTAGLAALLSLGYYGAASSGDGQGYELEVIAAAVVGGASLSGGRGSALGALLGALIIKMIGTGIVIVGIPQSWSQIIIGSVVILAVVLDQLNQWLSRRRQR